MPVYRYYLSPRIVDRSPDLEAMPSIEAESPFGAAERLAREGRLPPESASLWAHFVVHLDDSGQPRGFHSVPLSKVLRNPDEPTSAEHGA
jgi:hypothetical protein